MSLCNDAQVTLCDELDQMSEYDSSRLNPFATHEPTPICSLIAEAAYTLRERPGMPLATGLLPEVRSEDTVALSSLVTIINASIRPTALGDMPRFATGFSLLDACSKAEHYMADVIGDLDGAVQHWLAGGEGHAHGNSVHMIRGSQIFYDDTGAVFIRKGFGEPTAINLRPIAVDGISYPAGSVVAIETSDDIAEGEPYAPAKMAELSHTDEIREVTYLRLGGFALPAAVRTTIFNRRLDYLAGRQKRIFTGMNIAQIKQMADTALWFARSAMTTQ